MAAGALHGNATEQHESEQDKSLRDRERGRGRSRRQGRQRRQPLQQLREQHEDVQIERGNAEHHEHIEPASAKALPVVREERPGQREQRDHSDDMGRRHLRERKPEAREGGDQRADQEDRDQPREPRARDKPSDHDETAQDAENTDDDVEQGIDLEIDRHDVAPV